MLYTGLKKIVVTLLLTVIVLKSELLVAKENEMINCQSIIHANQKVTIANTKAADFVNDLKVSKDYKQLIIVASKGSKAKVTMHSINKNGEWEKILATSGFIGKQGVGKACEGRAITPAGVYNLSLAFGVNKNPGTNLTYVKVDRSYYWVDDIHSIYYNKFVSTKSVMPDWSSAEHIIDYKNAYAYSIAIDYNKDCIKGLGSAFFLHCSNGKPTEGCVSIPKKDMLFVLTHIKIPCAIVIDNEAAILNY